MKAMAFNGSARKDWNTARALKSALEGAASLGAETELVNLGDLDYKGCQSCFSCKLAGGESYGRCAARDGLTPVLARAEEADILIFGSPIYFMDVSASMRALLERLMFPKLVYDEAHSFLWDHETQGAFIYTMNMEKPDYIAKNLKLTAESSLAMMLASFESMYITDTCQLPDYGKYYAPVFDAGHKRRQWEEQLPLDLRRANDLGRRLAEKAAR